MYAPWLAPDRASWTFWYLGVMWLCTMVSARFWWLSLSRRHRLLARQYRWARALTRAEAHATVTFVDVLMKLSSLRDSSFFWIATTTLTATVAVAFGPTRLMILIALLHNFSELAMIYHQLQEFRRPWIRHVFLGVALVALCVQVVLCTAVGSLVTNYFSLSVIGGHIDLINLLVSATTGLGCGDAAEGADGEAGRRAERRRARLIARRLRSVEKATRMRRYTGRRWSRAGTTSAEEAWAVDEEQGGPSGYATTATAFAFSPGIPSFEGPETPAWSTTPFPTPAPLAPPSTTNPTLPNLDRSAAAESVHLTTASLTSAVGTPATTASGPAPRYPETSSSSSSSSSPFASGAAASSSLPHSSVPLAASGSPSRMEALEFSIKVNLLARGARLALFIALSFHMLYVLGTVLNCFHPPHLRSLALPLNAAALTAATCFLGARDLLETLRNHGVSRIEKHGWDLESDSSSDSSSGDSVTSHATKPRGSRSAHRHPPSPTDATHGPAVSFVSRPTPLPSGYSPSPFPFPFPFPATSTQGPPVGPGEAPPTRERRGAASDSDAAGLSESEAALRRRERAPTETVARLAPLAPSSGFLSANDRGRRDALPPQGAQASLEGENEAGGRRPRRRARP